MMTMEIAAVYSDAQPTAEAATNSITHPSTEVQKEHPRKQSNVKPIFPLMTQ